MYDLCELISRELDSCTKKLATNGQMAPAELDALDKEVHILKGLKTVIAMEEAYDMDEGSGYGSYMNSGRGSYNNGSYRNNYSSYRRGRDSMGRYTSRDAMSKADIQAQISELQNQLNNIR